jgi:hypothetical protein
MSLTRGIPFMLAIALGAPGAHAVEARFSGHWSVDLRTAEQKAKNMECGNASFFFDQVGPAITGSHMMATAGCGRINEGGEETVKGRVVGNRAFLLVTSGRNGAVVKGVATLKGRQLLWETKEEVKAGTPEGDSPLILDQGALTRVD